MDGAVSIIMATRNEEENIVPAVDSLMKQDYGKIVQLMIIDDESTDKTIPLARELEKKYPGRITILNKKHTGIGSLAKAYNAGLKMAKGEFIMQAETDAVFEKDFVSAAVKKINSDAGIAGVTPQCFFPGTGIWVDAANLFRKARVFLGNKPHSAKLYRKKLVLEAGGFDESVYFEDNALTRELRKLGYKVVWEGERPLWWHSVSGQLDTNFSFIRKAFWDGIMAVRADLKHPKRLIDQGSVWLLFFASLGLSVLSQLFLVPAVFLLALIGFWNVRYIYGALHYSKNPVLLGAMTIFVVLSAIAGSLGRIFGFGKLLLRA